MRFLSQEQTEALRRKFGIPGAGDANDAQNMEAHRLDISALPSSGSFGLARRLVALLGDFDQAIMSVTAYGIWPSSENLHLYFRLREAYGNRELLDDSPGHLFLRHEQNDMITFVQVALMNAWDLHLFTSQNYGRCFVSHDGWVGVVCSDPLLAQELAAFVASMPHSPTRE